MSTGSDMRAEDESASVTPAERRSKRRAARTAGRPGDTPADPRTDSGTDPQGALTDPRNDALTDPRTPAQAGPRADGHVPEPERETVAVPVPVPVPESETEPVPEPGAETVLAPEAGTVPEHVLEAEAERPLPRKPGLLRRSVLWVVAGAVLLGTGAGTAYGITSVSRDRVPGLATRSDGRWDFPELSLPALPSGVPRPFPVGDVTGDNDGEIHYADLRRLLIPVPRGVRADRSLNGGWIDQDRFLAEYPADRRDDFRRHLADDGLRHLTARGWTAADGTSVHVYLVQFQSAGNMLGFLTDQIGPGLTPGVELSGVDASELDQDWPDDVLIGGTRTDVYRQAPPYSGPGTHTRMAYIEAGDTLALVVERRGGAAAPEVPFHQTVVLQQQLLG